MSQDKDRMDRTYDDGGSGAVTDEQLEAFKAEVKQIGSDVAQKVKGRRMAADDDRFTRWDGQSPDGRRYDKEMPLGADGEPQAAFPFNGAPDERNRLADGVISFKKGRLVVALIRALRNPIVTGNDLQDSGFAADMARILKWLFRSAWRSKLIRDVELAADEMLSGSPGGVVVGMFMRQEMALDEVEVTAATIAERLAGTGLAVDEQGLADVMGLIGGAGGAGSGDAAELLRGLFPHVTMKRARRMVKELREDGKTSFPVPVYPINHPEPRVMRLYEDIFFPKDTVDLSKVNKYVTEWLDPVDLRARVVTHGYDPAFVDELLGEGEFKESTGTGTGHAGKSGFYEISGENNVAGDSTQENDSKVDLNKDRYEIITVYFRATNDDGIPADYQLSFSTFVERPAKERELSYKGGFPGVYFGREVLTKYLLDTRGLTEVLKTDQGLLKMVSDLFGASAQLKTLPALKTSVSRAAQGTVTLGPLVNVKVRKPSDVEPLDLGNFPREAFEYMAEIRRRVSAYAGFPHEQVPPEVAQMLDELQLMSWLWNWAEVFHMALQQVQEFFTDEQLERIADLQGSTVRRSKEEIQGRFDLTLTFAATDFDMEMILKKADALTNAMNADTDQTIIRSAYTRMIVSLAAPEWADQILQPQEQAHKREIEDEEMILTKILAGGIEPELDEDPRAKNYALRLDWLKNQMEVSPAWRSAGEVEKEILYNHIENYTQMVTQTENASVGRAGTKAVLQG